MVKKTETAVEVTTVGTVQSNADINKTEYEPLRHPAVKAARREKGDRKQQEQQNRDNRGSRLDALDAPLADTESHNQRHYDESYNKKQNIPYISSHGHGKRYGDHAYTGHHTEHPLTHSNSLVGDDIKPFFNHEFFYLS